MAISGTALFETWFQRVWKENDPDAIYELFSDGTAEGLGSQTIVNPEQFHDFQQKVSALVDNIEITIDKSIEGGDWTALLCAFKGNCSRTGEPVCMTGTIFGQVKDDKIVHAYNHWDFLGLFMQLGLLPEGSLERCLEGKTRR